MHVKRLGFAAHSQRICARGTSVACQLTGIWRPDEQKVFFDMTIGGAPAGRVTMQLETET